MTPDLTPVLQDETQLLGYGESDSYGPWIKLRLVDPDHLRYFRSQPTGKKLGKRFATVMVEIADDETPVDQEAGEQRHARCEEFMPSGEAEPAPPREADAQPKAKARTLSQEMFLMLKEPNFHRYLNANFATYGIAKDADSADRMVKRAFGIVSKRQIDTDVRVTKLFRDMVVDFRKFVNS